MKSKFLIIDDKKFNADIWMTLAREAGLIDLVCLVRSTSDLMLEEFRNRHHNEQFEGTIIDYSFQRGSNAGQFLAALTNKERCRLGRVVLATSKGAEGCFEVATKYCGNRLIQSMVRGDRLTKIKEFFGSGLSVEERIALLEDAVNNLSDRIKVLESK